MNEFHRSQLRPPLARTYFVVLLCGFVLTITGCAGNQRQSLYGNRGLPNFGGQSTPSLTKPDPLPTLAIPPETSAQPPSDAGPIILPRESVVQPGPYDFAFQRRNRSPATLMAPIIEPRSAAPKSLPSIRYADPPAELSGDIEIVPNSPHVGPLSQEKFFDIVPSTPETEETDEEPSLYSNKGYVELPPPPE